MRKNLKKSIGILLGLSMMAALSGCGGGSADKGTEAASSTQTTQTTTAGGSEGQGQATQEPKEDVGKNKLAYFFPLTGEQMQYGTMLQRGAQLAL